MIVKRNHDRFKKFYPDKKIELSKDHSSETEYVVYSTVGIFKIKVKDNEQRK